MVKSDLTAKIVEWDRQKGYGFLQLGKERVFLHRGDFAELVVFWLIVLAYQFAALDSLQNWQLSRAALKRLETTLEHRN